MRLAAGTYYNFKPLRYQLYVHIFIYLTKYINHNLKNKDSFFYWVTESDVIKLFCVIISYWSNQSLHYYITMNCDFKWTNILSSFSSAANGYNPSGFVRDRSKRPHCTNQYTNLNLYWLFIVYIPYISNNKICNVIMQCCVKICYF